jgi:hypothetical protein
VAVRTRRGVRSATVRIVEASVGHRRGMSEHEPREPAEDERPDEGGNPWAKTSSGNADEITEDDDE